MTKTTETTETIKINVYRCAGEWYGARWIGGEYDGCDELPCDSDASEEEAIECARTMPLAARGSRDVRRVEDVQ